jgi:hypothetical protein
MASGDNSEAAPPAGYVSSVTLVVTSEGLRPDEVSERLGLEPSRTWVKSEGHQTPGGRTPFYPARGGWTLFQPEALRDRPWEDQLRYWLELLEARADAIRSLEALEGEVTLHCLVASEDAVRLSLKPLVAQRLAKLGVGLELNVFLEET